MSSAREGIEPRQTSGLSNPTRVWLLDGLLCLAIALLGLWYFRAALWYVLGDDAIIHRYPFAAFISRALSGGELPLWNPYNWSGTPFVADISADFWYPLNLLYAFLPLDLVFSGFHLFHIAAGGVAAYGCARAYQLSRWGAVVAGLVYEVGPLFFHSVYNGYLILTIGLPYLPLILGLFHGAARRGSLRWAGLAGMALGLQILGSHIQLSAFSGGMLLAYVGHALWGDPRGGARRRRLALQLCMALGVGALIGAVKLLPFWVYAGEGFLLHGIGENTASAVMRLRQFYEASATSLSPLAWWHFIFPQPQTNLAMSVYVGAGALVLALIGGGGMGSRQPQGFFIVLVGLGLVLALGLYSPVQWLLFWLPGGQFLRRPERFLFFFILGVSLLAGRGTDRLRLNPEASRGTLADLWRRRPVRWSLLALGGANIAGVALLNPCQQKLSAWVDRLWQAGDAALVLQGAMRPVTTPEMALSGLREVVLRQLHQLFFIPEMKSSILGLSSLLAIGLIVAGAGRVLSCRGTGLAATIAVLGSCAGLHALYPTAIDYRNIPQEFFQETEVFRSLNDDRSTFRVLSLGPDTNYRIPRGVVRHNQGMVLGFEDVQGFDNYNSRRYVALTNLINGYPLQLQPLRPFEARIRNPQSDLINILNVKYVLSPSPVEGEAFELLMEDENGLKLYANRRFAPRAYLVYDWRVVADGEAALAALQEPGFDFRNQVLLEGELPAEFQHCPPDRSTGEVRIVRRSFNQMELAVHTAAPAVLVTSETCASGWQAFLDGEKTDIRCGDGVLRTIAVPPGAHQVLFRFCPRSAVFGGILTLCGLGVALIALRAKV